MKPWCLAFLAACAGSGSEKRPTDPTDESPSETGSEPTESCTVTGYFDADEDGFGAGEVVTLDCSEPVPIAAEAGDCFPEDSERFPGATEVCNGFDDNCDGVVDEGVLQTYFLDVDGDSYGHPNFSEQSCEPALGFVPVGGDCDEYDASRHPDPSSAIQFFDVTTAMGLDWVQWDLVGNPDQCLVESQAGGVGVSDLDGDGWHDIFLPRFYDTDLLLLGSPTGFVDATVASGVDAGEAHGAVVVADLSGDGLPDLYLTSIGSEPHRYYRNLGGATFSEEAASAGISGETAAYCSLHFSASVGDYDGDGDLDLHTTDWEPEPDDDNNGARLYAQEDGVFRDVTVEAGVDLTGHATFHSLLVDADDDGVTDLLSTADWGGSVFLRGQGDGTFVDVTEAVGVGTDENGMGAALADYDNDGDLDWFVSSIFDPDCANDWGCTGNRLYRNRGDGTFEDATDEAGVRDASWAWGAAFFDVENDGDLDLVVANGFPVSTFTEGRTRLFINDGGVFEEAACASSLVAAGEGRAVVPFDYDHDGDQDLLITRMGRAPVLLRNDSVGGAWLTVSLQGDAPNVSGVGATIRIGDQRRDLLAGSTYLGSVPLEAHFGLGALAGEVDVTVTWPDGVVSEHLVGVSQRVILTKP